MKYADFRPLIKTGDLLAFSHTAKGTFYDFQIHMVRKATESEFSHVGIAYVANGRVFILEAIGSGVRMFPLSRYLPFYHVTNPIELSEKALNWAFETLGAEYESKLLMLVKSIVNIKLNDNKRFQCSEYVNGIYAENNQFLTDVDTPSAIVINAISKFGSLSFVED
mgnify:CR=1 FL=1